MIPIIGEKPKTPFLTMKDDQGHSIDLFIENGEWEVVPRGAKMNDVMREYVKTLTAELNEEFDRRVKQYAEISYIGTLNMNKELFAIRIEKGKMTINGKDIEEFVDSADSELVKVLAKRGLGLRLQDA